ncbi:nicotinamidase [Kushneria aurantia]|uniref:nicotinamidase n=1 Tax=Kushneria aurantia TaxID=504092 RepID=A0ABV6G0U6_9GAMM|nr:nicotinamidase [Kushneria aurantia]
MPLNDDTTHADQRALLVVDLQPDFMPGGPLACERGDEIVDAIGALINDSRFGRVVASQDWHPPGHISFAGSHAERAPFDTLELYGEPHTLWPDHCVRGTPGAALDPRVDWSRADLILRKGSDPRIDSYSVFRDNLGPDGQRPATGLAGWLRERGVREVYLCGLAREVCVLWSAEDAAAAGFDTFFLWPLTRPVTSASDVATRQRLGERGIHIVDAPDMAVLQDRQDSHKE